MTSPYLDKPVRTYREALIDKAEAAAKRKGYGSGSMFITLYHAKSRLGDGTYRAVGSDFGRLDDAAEDAWHETEKGCYAGTLMLQEGMVKMLDLSEHGEELAKKREREEAEEHRDLRGLTYGAWR